MIDWPTERTYTTALFGSLTYLEKYCFCKKSVTNNFIPFLLFLYCTVFLPRFKCRSEEHEMYPRKFNLRHQRGDFTLLLFLDQINLPPPNKKPPPFNNFVLCTLPTPSTIRTALKGYHCRLKSSRTQDIKFPTLIRISTMTIPINIFVTSVDPYCGFEVSLHSVFEQPLHVGNDPKEKKHKRLRQ